MRTTHALAASAAAVALVGIAAPTATAWEQPTSVVATPNAVARGGQIVLTVSGGNACATMGSTISSNAFPTTNLRSRDGRTATATVRINANANPGAYDVFTHCEGQRKKFEDVFTVIGGVRGGLGGSSSTGATPTDIAIGGGLVAAALIGGGLFWMRRRSENKI
ncbi:LPXTG cell wall anchor domain-containing protein [Streptomyces tailanensis]|uniref:LPXTG cell wall anchor domain-containing protein n=1 Tax=Streptomyces tailanensis TaxID=2569858 RepID=UPI00122E0153|nr:LPXTG cell wall anchor domain-containing protein [Streptomyces tailanensis]